MRISGPFITAGILDGYDAFLAQHGTGLAAVMRTAELPYRDVNFEERSEIPLADAIAIFEAASNLTNDPCLGAAWGEILPVGATGPYGYMLVNASSLGHALQVTTRYLALVVYPVIIELEYIGGDAHLSWTLTRALQPRGAQYAQFTAAGMVQRLRAVAGPNWNPKAVHLACPELPCAGLTSRVFNSNLTFGGQHTRIVIDAEDLDRSNERADPRLFRLMQGMADQILQERTRETKLTRIARRAISARLGQEDVSLESIAAVLKLSPRTLQSRLAAEGTSFEAVLQHTKQRLAENYLRDTDLPLTEIAMQLGFSELSAFTRASTRWFNMPPSALRQHLRPVTLPEDSEKPETE